MLRRGPRHHQLLAKVEAALPNRLAVGCKGLVSSTGAEEVVALYIHIEAIAADAKRVRAP